MSKWTKSLLACNVGKADRVFRGILGSIILGVGLWMCDWWAVLGVLLILTAFTGRCPLYMPLKLGTTDESENQNEREDDSSK